jgi:hypothetical protein
MARAAGVSALAGLLEERLPPLWQAGSEDIRTTLATFSNPERFADLTHRFFSALLDRNLHYFVDRELPRHVGREGLVRSAGGLSQFDRAMQQHCEESTFIMRAYARDWLGKNVFKEQRRLTERDVIAFASIALTKLGKELSVRSRPD